MIISASRRTDIPAFYSEWLMNRIRSGYCHVPNPFNRSQVSFVSLKPEHVDVIVFWTRNPRPLLPYLAELDDRGFRYYFLHTLMDNPRQVAPGTPPFGAAIRIFRELSDRIGPKKVVWRYDPILLTSITGPGFHEDAYNRIANALNGYTARSIISIAHIYRKIQKRIRELENQGVELLSANHQVLLQLMASLAGIAGDNGMEIRSCADEMDLQGCGIQPGKCVDDELIAGELGLKLDLGKDTCQRKQCGCIRSKDIGMYDSCLFGCVYCYATTSFGRARANYRMHNPLSASLLDLGGEPLPSDNLTP